MSSHTQESFSNVYNLRRNELFTYNRTQSGMSSTANSLGRFLGDLMRNHQHNNSSLAQAAGVSESVIRNMLKHGLDTRAKDPDPRTLRRVADALGVDSLMLFRMAGYISPAPDTNTVRAEYLADLFDRLPPEKQDAVMSVLEAMSEQPTAKSTIQQMRQNAQDPLAGIDLNFPGMLREAANQLIAHYQMTQPQDVDLIEDEIEVLRNKWGTLPPGTRHRVQALIRRKLSLEYDSTLVDPEWRE
jgi:transcriptional regulator with XRE-family HTH domain